ncbi:MAG TPA: hypothetical protein VGA09_03730, partial [Candidatus Binatia bacterium]
PVFQLAILHQRSHVIDVKDWRCPKIGRAVSGADLAARTTVSRILQGSQDSILPDRRERHER